MDERENSIIRQVAFKGAIETLKMVSTDLYKDLDEVVTIVESLTDRFEGIIHKGADKNRDRDFDDPDYDGDEDTRPVCNVCHTILAHKTGVSKKTNKPWGAWMCPDRDCKGTPVWD